MGNTFIDSTQVKTDSITDTAGTGSPSFPNGVSASSIKLFRSFQSSSGNALAFTVSSSTQAGTINGVTLPRAASYRIRIQASCAGSTTANCGVVLSIQIKRASSNGNFASATAVGVRGTASSQTPTVAFRPFCQAVTEHVASFSANDVIYFSIESFDTQGTGGLGGGSVFYCVMTIEELPGIIT